MASTESRTDDQQVARQLTPAQTAVLRNSFDDLQYQLDTAREALGNLPDGSERTRLLDLVEEFMNLLRANSLNEAPDGSPVAPPEPENLAAIVERTQAELNRVREQVRGSVYSSDTLERIEQSDKQLEAIRSRLLAPGLSRPSPTEERQLVEDIYDRAQRRIDAARRQVADSPNAEALLKRLDAAQRQLDQGRAQAGLPPVDE